MSLGKPQSPAWRTGVTIFAGIVLAGAIVASLAFVSPTGFGKRPAARGLLQIDKPVLLDQPAH